MDNLLFPVDTLATFEDAVSLSVDQKGRLYVVDAQEATLTQLGWKGVVHNTWGGPGQGDYEFDEPMDADPSKGLIILVADAGNGAIKRYSSEFLHLGTFSLSEPEQGRTSGYRVGEGNPDAVLEGRPVAIAASFAEELYAIDADRNAVIKWDADRRVERIFGSYNDGDGALVDPVALAVDAKGQVFVADAGQQSVLVYDAFGTYVRSMGAGQLEDVRAVAVYDGRLLVVLPRRVLVYETRGLLLHTYGIEGKEPLVDVAVADRDFYLLTATHLLRSRP